MDYKKELEDALERARKLDSPFYRQAAEIIFPQLKENADEKILRIIKNALDSYFDGRLSDGTNDVDYAECLAWVNKQLYKKPTEEFVRDSKLIEEVCSYLNRYGNLLDERDPEYAAKIFKLADELKSQEVKSIWKPIPEQTSILWDVVCTLKHDNYKHTDIVESLYNELKKL